MLPSSQTKVIHKKSMLDGRNGTVIHKKLKKKKFMVFTNKCNIFNKDH